MKYRDNNSKKAIVLIHGLGGETVWQPLVKQLLNYPPFDNWDVHSFEYNVQWRPRLVRFGLALSPSLSKVANLFSTYCQSKLSSYRSISILAHSAGGLVVQRAFIDSPWLQNRTRNIGLFGTPSAGVPGKRIFGLINPQIRDLLAGSQFLTELIPEQAAFKQLKSFNMRIVSSLDDKTVPNKYAFADFPESMRRTVPGDHVTMIQPADQDSEVFRVITHLLLKPRIFLSYVREDEERVSGVYRTLEEQEFAPWIDQQNIEPGENWELSIQGALHESDCFLVFISKAAVSRLSGEGSVFMDEIRTAVEIDKTREAPFLIPVRLEDCALPECLKMYQWFDLFSKGAESLTKFLDLYLM